jgi:diguanylate cyclase (GGDEF)-like protein
MSPPPAPTQRGPWLDLRVRWRVGWLALVAAGLVTLLTLQRPLAHPGAPYLRLAMTVLLGLGVAGTAMLASLRGRGLGERLALYAFLILSVDGLGQVSAPLGWPIWPLMALLLAGLAVAEPLRVALAATGLAGILAASDVVFRQPQAWRPALVVSLAYLALALVIDRGLAAEKRRLMAALAELTRLKHGIDQLEPGETTAAGMAFSTAALTLRQVSEEGRRARQVERAGQLYDNLGRLVSLARRALNAHAVLYFEIDREREQAYVRAADGPETLARDAAARLALDPFSFVLDRDQAFYATDFKRLLWALPYYRAEVRIGTLLAVPVRVGGSIIGVLLADQIETQGLTGGAPDVLESLAEIAAQTVLDTKAALSREELGAEFKAVYEVSRKLAMQTDPAPVRLLLLRSASDLVALEAAAVVMVDEAQTRYIVEDATGWAKEFVGREVGLPERTWTAWVLRSAEEPYLLEDIAGGRDRMPLFVLDEGLGRTGSLLALPLRARNRTLGALVLMARRGAFDAAARRVLGILANQGAALLHIIQLLGRIKDQALRDGLTELYNRRAFDDFFARALAREQRQDGRLGLVLLDLDHFKNLNDTFGHRAGDAALRSAAQVMERHLRRADQAARYGGEEFVIVLPGTDEKGALRLADRIRAAIHHHHLVFEGARLSVSVSLGVAIAPQDGKTPQALLAAADRALYAAKHAGRNRVVAASSLPADLPSTPTSAVADPEPDTDATTSS